MKKRFAIAALLASAAVFVAAVPVMASVVAKLQVTQTKGYYGQETVLQPSVDATVVPGATFQFEASKNASDWAQFGELQGVEDTGSVDPLYHIWDNSMSYPTYVRVAYRSKGVTIGAEPTAVTQPVRLYALRYLCSTVRLHTPSTATLNRPYTVGVTVSPNAGEGPVRVGLYKFVRGEWKLQRAVTVKTDELGAAAFSVKPTSAGTYKLRVRFGGNQFSVPSTPAFKFFTVK